MKPEKIEKKVFFPIEVPIGRICIGRPKGRRLRVCKYFNGETRPPVCKLMLGELKYDEASGFVWKPSKCLTLKGAKVG